MVSVAKVFETIEPLSVVLPKSASEFYNLVRADLTRIESDVHIIENALLTVDYSCSYQYKFSIALENGSYYEQLPQLYEIEPCENVYDIDETVGFIEDKFTVFNVCHFIFDKLSRTVELKNCSIDSFLLFRKHPYFDDVFSTLGLTQTKLGEHNNGVVTYKIKKLCVSSSSFRFRHPGFNFRPEVMEMLQSFKKKCLDKISSVSGYKRIYVDRNTVGARNIENKDVFYAVLSKFGFDCIAFEDYSLFEQANIVNGADIMLGIHGAGLTNAMFFDKPSFKLLEILPPLCAHADYWKMSNAFGIDYDAFIAKDLHRETPDYSTWVHDRSLNRRDILIDEGSFTEFLELHT